MLINKYLKQGFIQPEDIRLLLIALDEIQDKNHEYAEACDLIRTLANTPRAMVRQPELVFFFHLKAVRIDFYGSKYCHAHFHILIPNCVQILFEMKKGSQFRDKMAQLLVKLLNRPRELTVENQRRQEELSILLAKRIHELYT